eukprot:10891-Chlamydomonas_euryale.AAC.3
MLPGWKPGNLAYDQDRRLPPQPTDATGTGSKLPRDKHKPSHAKNAPDVSFRETECTGQQQG